MDPLERDLSAEERAAFMDMCAARRDFFRKLRAWLPMFHDDITARAEVEGTCVVLRQILALQVAPLEPPL